MKSLKSVKKRIDNLEFEYNHKKELFKDEEIRLRANLATLKRMRNRLLDQIGLLSADKDRLHAEIEEERRRFQQAHLLCSKMLTDARRKAKLLVAQAKIKEDLAAEKLSEIESLQKS